MPSAVAVIVSGYVPTGVEPDVCTVSVDVPPPVIVAGLKLAVAPAGRPLAVRLTAPLKFPCPVTVVVNVVAPPCPTVCEAGEALSVNDWYRLFFTHSNREKVSGLPVVPPSVRSAPIMAVYEFGTKLCSTFQSHGTAMHLCRPGKAPSVLVFSAA